MAISAVLMPDDELGPHGRRSGKAIDIVKVTGSTGAADDTTTVTLKNGARNAIALGGSFLVSSETATLAGVVITLKAKVALGNDSVHVEILSDAG